jgi:hypothetical protein
VNGLHLPIDAAQAPPAERATAKRLAGLLRPRPRWRPSHFAERFVTLSRRATGGYEGPMRMDYLPPLRDIVDTLYDHPGKRGIVVPKPSQRGLTLSMLALLGCWLASEDGNAMYVIGRERETEATSRDRFEPLTRSAPLRARFGHDGDNPSAESLPAGVLARGYDGGTVFFGSAGSVAALSTNTVTLLAIDEYDQCEAGFPSAYGAFYEFILGRQTAPSIRDRSVLLAWSHPTSPDRGIWRLWHDRSDQGRWVFACPTCGGTTEPGPERLVWPEGKPSAAEYRCECCGHAISDAQRARALWAPPERGGRDGGTGHFSSPLPPDEAARRPYAGRAIDGLADPGLSAAYFAEMLENARGDTRKLQAVHNIHFGRALAPAGEGLSVTAPQLEAIIRPQAGQEQRGRVLLPGGPRGARIAAVGADVQAPQESPHIYLVGGAATGDGRIYLTGFAIRRGFAAAQDWVRTHAPGVVHGDPGDQPGTLAAPELGVLPVQALGIDDGYESGAVKDACRAPLYHADGSGFIRQIPMRFVSRPGLNNDTPIRLRDEAKRTDPTRPHLGAIDMYDLFRHYWVERTIAMMRSGLIVCLATPPADLLEQLSAQVLARKRTPHTNWEEAALEWDKAKDRRDDWHMALCYLVAVMAARLNLDRVEQLPEPLLVSGGRLISQAATHPGASPPGPDLSRPPRPLSADGGRTWGRARDRW